MAKQTKAQKAQVEDAVIVEQTTLPTFVESTVKKEVQKIDVAEAAILEKVKKYKNLKVKDKDDEKGITLVKEAYQDLVKTRTSIDKKRAEIKKPFLDVGKGIDDYAKKLTAMFADVENTLKLENDKVKQWEKEAEEQKEAERQAKIKARVEELTTAGITFNGELYVIGDTISVDIVTIEKMSDADFAFLAAKVKAEKEKKDKAEAEAKAKAEAEEAQRKADAEKVEREKKAVRAEKLEMRTEKLEAIGFTTEEDKERFIYSGEGGFFELSFDEAAEMSLDDFKAYIEKTKTAISEKTEAAQKERENKAKADEEAKAKADAEKAERLPDLEKISLYTDELLKVPIPQLKNETAGEILATFKKELKLSIDKALTAIKKLS